LFDEAEALIDANECDEEAETESEVQAESVTTQNHSKK